MIEDLQGSRQQYEDDHFDTMAAMSNLAQLYYKRGTFDDSLPIAREALRLRSAAGSANEQTLLHRLVQKRRGGNSRERQQLQRQQHEEEKRLPRPMPPCFFWRRGPPQVTTGLFNPCDH